MLLGTRHGLRRLSSSQAPLEPVTVCRNEPFLPFLYPREFFPTLTQKRYVRCLRVPPAVGNNRHNSPSSNCYSHTRSSSHYTLRNYTAPPSASNATPTTSNISTSHFDESGNRENDGVPEETEVGPSNVDDARSPVSDTPSAPSSAQSMDVYKEVDAIGANSSGVVRQVRAEQWWRKQLERELSGKPPLKQNKLYVEWMDIMNEIMALKRDAENKPAPAYAKTIYLSETDVVALAGDERENVWDIRVLSGCRVHILPRERDSVDFKRKVVLTGSPEAVRLAEKEIRADIQTAHTPEGGVPDWLPPFVTAHDWKRRHNIDVPQLRSVWTHNLPLIAKGRRSRNPIRADVFRRPKKWTIKKFGDYLESITNLSFSSPVHSLLYPDGRLNRDVIIDIIRELFTNPHTKQFLSTRAVNSVIFYCYRYPQYLPVLLSLFPNFEHLMTTRTFNALLAGCSKNCDLDRFRYLISLMKRCGVKPNGLEWVAFVDTILSSNVRQKVVARLRKEGLLDDERVLRRLIYRIIPDAFASHLDSGQSVKDYFAVMDKRYGQGWICTDSIKPMLGVTVRLHNSDAAHDIIEICKQREIKLDVQCMNYGVAVHRNRKQYSEAIAVYLDLVNHFLGLTVNNETVRILFSAAWEARYYNTCRVIWTYACLWGLVSSSMKHMVFDSLLRNTVTPPGNESEANWFRKAGKAIVGIKIDMSDLEARFDTIKNAPPTPDQELLGTDNVVSLLIEYQPAGELRSQQRQLAHWIIKKDFEAVWRYQPQLPFSHMMWEAHALDMGWARGHAENMPIAEVVKNVIKIPVDEKVVQRDREKDGLSPRSRGIGESEVRDEPKKQQEQQPQELEQESKQQTANSTGPGPGAEPGTKP
ncbi:conserved hypothetical protein [Histoplasma capsulatum G186AR]|uniref:K Homology domain-containing protein n=2 Tax=Ajellomyces capsulatus TaxID=5037 RepID=C0NGL1_AJECG|nr:uncharacterized protein HCBG_02483 [Histoplasma capsulatum G186AR]EEH08946.1 conserved hypothetical protein [Histoplasma capsulatum G186AR]KAG5303736.1 pentatricopeptide repeat protein [Histoplasma capsulatum]QSS69332.1 pentatricopeptide repeat protein [Histoplasma capsulatum G186AR]